MPTLRNTTIALVVFDLAGTTVDHGCFSPVEPFVETLRRHGVTVSINEVRAPMGMGKLDHLRTLLAAPSAAAQWRAHHGADATDADIERAYNEDFVPLQLECVPRSSNLISGTLECVAVLRERGIKIGTTTGYFRAAAELCWAAAAEQGFVPDINVAPEDVPTGRPAPWMIYRIMQALDVYPPRSVVKVGDTIPDIDEALSAGVWSVAVAQTGSELALSEKELAALPPEERDRRTAIAREKLLAAGADYVIDSVRDLPALLPVIEARMRTQASHAITE